MSLTKLFTLRDRTVEIKERSIELEEIANELIELLESGECSTDPNNSSDRLINAFCDKHLD